MSYLILTWILASAASAALTGLVMRYALRRQLLDVPNERSSHRVPTPRGGGLAIAIVASAGIAQLATAGQMNGRVAVAILVAGGAVAAIGWIDDRRGVSPIARFLIHAAAVAIVLAGTAALGPLAMPGLDVDSPLQIAAAFVALVWLINLFNFMDGIDGLAAGEAVFFTIGLLICLNLRGSAHDETSAHASLLGAAALGFLMWNWPPARIFMGDIGSGYLGFGLGALALVAHRQVGLSIWIPTILLALFVTDATLTLLRRMSRGERWHVAHRSHAYQWLARMQGSHRPVTISAMALNVLWLLPLAALAALYSKWAAVLAAVAYLPIVVLALRLGAGRPE